MAKLTSAEQMDLIVHYQRTGCIDTAELLLKENMGLIRKVVSRFSTVLGKDDMMQCGMLGFYEGLSKFDTSRGLQLSTYMYPYVYGHVQRWARNFQIVRTNRTTQELHFHARKVIEEYYTTHKREISSSELAEVLKVPNWRAVEIIQTMTHYTASLDAPSANEDSDSTFADGLPQYDKDLNIENMALRQAISSLDKQHQYILKAYYFGGYSQQEIADSLGITQTAISRILKKIHKELKSLLVEV